MRLFGYVLALLVLAGLFLPSRSFAASSSSSPKTYEPVFHPFEQGESASYRATWSGVPVASADVETRSVLIDGRKYYRVEVQARTWKYLELIWKMRDSIESIFEHGTLRPRRFVFRQRENRKKTDTTAVFESETKKWVIRRKEGKKIKDFEFVSQDTLDPISAVYLARSLDFKVGDMLRLDVFGGKSRYQVTMDVVGQERITTKAGEFNAYKIVPKIVNLTKSGYAGRVRQATVWISADEKRRPLKVVSQVFIGTVNIEWVGTKS
ncbi:MAG: DUF3108 domain-containing protein [Deltaproteobacteria bacterium]|nr:DUF3108 domain-containing protein [Deltaproteobacteria bacterium]